MKFIQYNLSGKVVEQYLIDFSHWDSYPLGEKVRITTNDGQIYVGFWNTFVMNHQLPTKIKIGWYDLDEKAGKLRSGKDIADYVPVKEIAKVEAILYSNPSWGIRATNKFVFSKSVEFDFQSDLFKDWPQK